MKLTLRRLQLDPDVTIGSLSDGDKHLMWVLEDPVREVKIPGETAIPYGIYRVDITWSLRFARRLPVLLNVPNFSGIRIHPGNSVADTAGCLLPGLERYEKTIGRSRDAFLILYTNIKSALRRGEPVHIDITR